MLNLTGRWVPGGETEESQQGGKYLSDFCSFQMVKLVRGEEFHSVTLATCKHAYFLIYPQWYQAIQIFLFLFEVSIHLLKHPSTEWSMNSEWNFVH